MYRTVLPSLLQLAWIAFPIVWSILHEWVTMLMGTVETYECISECTFVWDRVNSACLLLYICRILWGKEKASLSHSWQPEHDIMRIIWNTEIFSQVRFLLNAKTKIRRVKILTTHVQNILTIAYMKSVHTVICCCSYYMNARQCPRYTPLVRVHMLLLNLQEVNMNQKPVCASILVRHITSWLTYGPTCDAFYLKHNIYNLSIK